MHDDPSSTATDFEVIPLPDPQQAMSLAGMREANLKWISRYSGAWVTLRGQDLYLKGTPQQRQQVRQWLELLKPLWQAGQPVTTLDAEQAFRALTDEDALVYRQAQATVLARTRKGELIRPKTPRQQDYVRAIRAHDLCFGIGPAGTGKTYLAAVMAIAALQNREYERLILTRPAVEAGEKLGFLPGDLVEKVDPYLRPLYDALFEFIDPTKLPQLMEQGVIEVAPLAYMRGRTLSNAFIILDEAQNTTPEQMKMVLTRLGFKSRMVVTGDLTQTDLGSHRPSGLATAERILGGVEGIAFCYFDQRDVVRHPLVQRIVEAYERYEARE
ncbi:PhoH family protein [Thermostichus vulcanus]|uniref:PhoH-like protein n=1 Tax=Thermostichus vulcanus str. 'Rupite' TaxID=2813851 RepID=A0ABT0CDE0_THEVL|nr:PhoH family protein [Thermostichus vulcanus]MCJ2543801.1 PhoH family protein [Thermostichus vulcanus str. 'Rupite']